MARDPMAGVKDAPLFIVPRVLERLHAFRDGPKLADLPGENPSPERERLAVVLDDLATRLLAGIEAHPTRFWALKQCQQSLELVQKEDTGAREHFGRELDRLIAILGIQSADGMLDYYLKQR